MNALHDCPARRFSAASDTSTVGFARSMRHEIDQLLLALWADPACKTSLVALAKESAKDSEAVTADDASGGVLVDYARAVLNDLMYLLKVNDRRPSPFAEDRISE